MAREKRRADYYEMTSAIGPDDGLFGHKLVEICANISPADRETDYKGTSVLLDVLEAEPNDGLIKGVVYQNRTTAPTKRKQGKTQTTPVELDTDEGIDEKTHFVYCPKTAWMCIEYNYHGPKIGLLKSVVNKLYKDVDKDAPRSNYMLVKRGKAYNEVVDSKYIKTVMAKLKDPALLAGIDGEPDLPEVYDEFKPPENSSIEIKVTAKERTGFAYRLNEFRRKFLRDANDIDNFEKLQVVVLDDPTGKVEHYDLVKDKLQDEFMADKREGTSEIDTDSMIKKLTELLTKVKEEYRIR